MSRREHRQLIFYLREVMATKTEEPYRKAPKKKEFKYDEDRNVLRRQLGEVVDLNRWILWFLIFACVLLIGVFIRLLTL